MSTPRARPILSVLVYTWVGGLILVHALCCLILAPYTLLFDRDRRAAARLGASLVRFSLRLVPSWRATAHGLAAIDLSRPAVVVINHRSIGDIAVALAIPGAPRLSAKPWVAKLPLVRLGMWTAGHEIFDPTDMASVRANLERLEGLLARGVSVLFFPEGTRQTEADLGRFEGGAFWLATRTGVDVLPIVLHSIDELVPRGRMMFHHADPRVEVLPRIPAGADRDELENRVHAAMATALAAAPGS